MYTNEKEEKMSKETYRIVITEHETKETSECSVEEFVDILSGGGGDCPYTGERYDVYLRIYELGEGVPPSSELGKIVHNEEGRYVYIV